jgi:hypothetical protein
MAQIYGSGTWAAEVWFSEVERYYLQNCQLPEGRLLEESEVKALSYKLLEVISWFRRRPEPFSLKKITIQGHDTYAFSTSMHDVDHIFVFDDEGHILNVIEWYEVCSKDGDGTVEAVYAIDCPEQYWRHAE